MIRVYRLMRDVGAKTIKNQLLYNRAGSVLYLTVFLRLLIIQMAGVMVLNAEAANPDAQYPDAFRCHLVDLPDAAIAALIRCKAKTPGSRSAAPVLLCRACWPPTG